MKNLMIAALTLLTMNAEAMSKKAPAPEPVVVAPTPAPSPAPVPPVTTGGNCELMDASVVLKQGAVKLPATGSFVLESHLATKEDKFGTRLFPKNVSENIQAHTTKSCLELKKLNKTIDCTSVYSNKYMKEWTPPEGGKAGQGSVGDVKPSVVEEMWSGNMMWAAGKKPAPGTRFLASFQGKSVVVIVGYETGPANASLLGGMQGEVLWYLGAKSEKDLITIGWLKDQSLPPGPITCK